MKTSLPIFLAVFVALGASFGGFVAGPIAQLGAAKQTTVLNSTETYPVQRTGDAVLGLQVYRANGCAACHTEQVRQAGFGCDVVLTGWGKNEGAVRNVLRNGQEEEHWPAPKTGASELPMIVLHNVMKETADAVVDQLAAVGGKAEVHLNALGVDMDRHWGLRRSVATDYLWDYPVQLGGLRAGPDLANVGVRLGNASWQLQHLYAPQSVTEKSAMPPFRYLFEVQKIEGDGSPDAVPVSGKFAPPKGFEVVPTEDAKNLAAYLLSLRADVPLYEAPFTPEASAAPATNAPAETK